eukprot:CFRG8605T1
MISSSAECNTVCDKPTQFICDDKQFVLVDTDGTSRVVELQNDFHIQSWLFVCDPEDVDDQEHPTFQNGAIQRIEENGILFVNVALSERTYGRLGTVEELVEKLNELPRPTVIQCNTTRRASAVLTLYHAFKEDLDYSAIQEYASKYDFLYRDSPELVGWVNRNAPAAKPPPAYTIDAEEMAKRKEIFMKELGYRGYGYKGAIDNIRAKDFKRMGDQVYLDYTGSGQYRESQIGNALLELQTTLFGNSHSHSPSSMATEHELNEARDLVLQFFNASQEEYSVVFTNGATGALKIVGESFPFMRDSMFAFLNVNHNSVVGIREYAYAKGAHIVPLTDKEVERCLECKCKHGAIPYTGSESLDSWDQQTMDDQNGPDAYMDDKNHKRYNLFAYPPEDNFCGVKYPLDWIERIEKVGLCGRRDWKVVLDAAAFVPTQPLDLSKYKPSFVDISFYKIFGYPSGLGALLVRNDTLPLLQRRYFGGGTIILATVKKHFVQFARKRATRFEDGTLSFLSIAALKYGFSAIRELGIENIQQHTYTLSRHMYKRLSALRHYNGEHVVQIYGKWEMEEEEDVQGPIVTFTAYHADQTPQGYHGIQIASSAASFHIRTGAHCNPGGVDMYLHLGEDNVERYARQKTSCGDDLDVAEGKHLGTVRVSCGAYSTFEDVEKFCSWFEDNYVERRNDYSIAASDSVSSSSVGIDEGKHHLLVNEVPISSLLRIASDVSAQHSEADET